MKGHPAPDHQFDCYQYHSFLFNLEGSSDLPHRNSPTELALVARAWLWEEGQEVEAGFGPVEMLGIQRAHSATTAVGARMHLSGWRSNSGC